MKFHVERDVFVDAVAWAAKSLPARPTMPVLSGLVIDAGENNLELSGFDYEISSQVSVASTTVEPGRTIISGRLLADIVRSLPHETVQVEVSGTRAELRCGRAVFTMPTMSDDEYPEIPHLPPTVGTIDSQDFAGAVGQVTVAAGRDDGLPVLTGAYMEFSGDRLTLVATDRYRLAVREIGWTPDDPTFETSLLVPARTLAEVAKTLTAGESVSLSMDAASGASILGFEGAGRRTTTRLIDEKFPPFRSLLPSESSARAEIEIAEVAEAVRRVGLVLERSSPIRLTFGDGSLRLEAGGNEDAQATEEVPASYEGEALTIAFNPAYLLDGLSALGGNAATLSFTGAFKPAMITGRDGAAGFRYLLMPVRLSS